MLQTLAAVVYLCLWLTLTILAFLDVVNDIFCRLKNILAVEDLFNIPVWVVTTLLLKCWHKVLVFVTLFVTISKSWLLHLRCFYHMICGWTMVLNECRHLLHLLYSNATWVSIVLLRFLQVSVWFKIWLLVVKESFPVRIISWLSILLVGTTWVKIIDWFLNVHHCIGVWIVAFSHSKSVLAWCLIGSHFRLAILVREQIWITRQYEV